MNTLPESISRILSLPRRVVRFYIDGFRQMTWGRWLWAMILIKVAVLLLLFRLVLLPDRLQQNYDTDADRARAVRSALTDPPR